MIYFNISLGGAIMSDTLMQTCATMFTIQKILGGKWKILILWYLSINKVLRFNELYKILGNITQATLTKQLRELQNDGFIIRYVYPEVPPKVEYSLSDLGKSLIPVLNHLKDWGDTNIQQSKNG